MLNGVPGGDPLTFSVAVVAAAAASLLIYRDAGRHGHYHALSASLAVGIAALVGFFAARLVGLAVATGYVLLLYLLSYPSTPGIDGIEKRRTRDRPDEASQGNAGENGDDVVSVIRVEIAGEGTLRELATRYGDVPDGAPVDELRSMLRVKVFDNVLDADDVDGELNIEDWSEPAADSVDDWHDESPSAASTRPAEGAAAWNAAPAGDETDDQGRSDGEADTGTGEREGVEEWGAETVDEDAAEVEAGSIEEWTAVGDGAESVVEAGNEASSVTVEDGGFGWAEVEAEE